MIPKRWLWTGLALQVIRWSKQPETKFGLNFGREGGKDIISLAVEIAREGEIISEIIPELWLLRRHGLHLSGPYSTRSVEQLTVASKNKS